MLPFAELPGGGGGADESCFVDSQLWLACAGSMCTVPPVGAAVYYFPQGHAEQAAAPVDLQSSGARVPPTVACRVAAVRYMADPDNDEVFAKIHLTPLRPGEAAVDVGEAAAGDGQQDGERPKPVSFAKTLTQSDANNGGGFSVPRFCAETIFPELDYSSEPPVQNVFAKDAHGAEWKFRHIYRGTPRRHLLTTGWSNFVNQKKLLAGDSIVFMRGEGGDVHVGIRRAKRGFCGGGGGDEGLSSLPGWDQYKGLMRGNANSSSGGGGGGVPKGKVPPENVATAARMAIRGQPFEVLYYPRASTPEFCVRAGAVRAAMQVQWCPGLRFKMPFETEDSSRISWFMGTIAGAQVADPIRWPQSPWRLLQVTWDEPELLQNVKRVCPWLVELVSSMPNFHLPRPFSPPRKKPRIPPYAEFPHDGQLMNPLAAHGHGGGFPFLPFPDSSGQPACIQGARHAQFPPSFSDLHVGNGNHLQPGGMLYPGGVRLAPPPAASSTDHAAAPRRPQPRSAVRTDLTIALDDASCSPPSKKSPVLMLFGKEILTEEQMKVSNASECSGSGVTQGSPVDNTPRPAWTLQCFGGGNGNGSNAPEYGQEPGQCKVFVESDDVGRNIDLSALGSFDELYARLSAMFSIESADLRSHVLYRSAAGEVKHVGDEPFCTFVKSAKMLTILTDSGSDNLGSWKK